MNFGIPNKVFLNFLFVKTNMKVDLSTIKIIKIKYDFIKLICMSKGPSACQVQINWLIILHCLVLKNSSCKVQGCHFTQNAISPDCRVTLSTISVIWHYQVLAHLDIVFTSLDIIMNNLPCLNITDIIELYVI